jgi:outer membrane protein assembly factor BamB
VIDLRRGESIRSVEMDGPTGVTAACVQDMVYFGTESGTIFAINWKLGEVVWEYRDEAKSLPIRSSPAVSEGLVVIGGHSKRVVALEAASGELRWSFAARNRIESSPVVVDQRVFIGGNDGRLYALNLKTGELLAEYELGGRLTASPAVASRRLVIANDQGAVYCLGSP